MCVLSCGVDPGCTISVPVPKHANHTPPDILARRVRQAVGGSRRTGDLIMWPDPVKPLCDEFVDIMLDTYSGLYQDWHRKVHETPLKIEVRIWYLATEIRSPCCGRPYDDQGSCLVQCADCQCSFRDICHRMYMTGAACQAHINVCATRKAGRCELAIVPPLDPIAISIETRELPLRMRLSRDICHFAKVPHFSIVCPPMGAYTWNVMVLGVLADMQVVDVLGIQWSDLSVYE